jgi:glutaredoxin
MKFSVRAAILNTALLVSTVGIAIPFGTYLAQYYQSLKSHSRIGNFEIHVKNMPHEVTLYGTSTCKYCKLAREHLHATHINFNDLLIDQAPMAESRFNQLGESSVPVLVTEHRLIIGFHPEEFNDLLKLYQSKQ